MVPIEQMDRREIKRALRAGDFVLHLGPFDMRLKAATPEVADFIADTYRHCQASVSGNLLTDFSLDLRPPNMVRRFIRRQITPDPGFYFPTVPLPPSMAALALEMGMNLAVALQCFRYVIYHAGVVADDRGAIVISAHSGGGKSTLTAALMQQGYRLLSDEFAMLATGTPDLVAYPRPVSLKNESVGIVRAFAGDDQMSPVLEGTPKGTIGYRRARASDIAMMHKTARADLLLFPAFRPGAMPVARKLETGEALMRFIAGSPNYHALGEPAFLSLMAFAEGVRAYEITYGSTHDSLALVKSLRETGTRGTGK